MGIQFPLLLSFTYCTFIYVYIFLFCTLVKRIIKLKLLKLKLICIIWKVVALIYVYCPCNYNETLIKAVGLLTVFSTVLPF